MGIFRVRHVHADMQAAMGGFETDRFPDEVVHPRPPTVSPRRFAYGVTVPVGHALFEIKRSEPGKTNDAGQQTTRGGRVTARVAAPKGLGLDAHGAVTLALAGVRGCNAAPGTPRGERRFDY